MKKKPFDPKFDPKTTTLAQAQEVLKEHAVDGAICPACRQLVKMAPKALSPNLGYTLLVLYRHFVKESTWLHVADYLGEMVKMGSAVKGSDYTKLCWWGLLEEMPEDLRKKEKKKPGFYRMTEKGLAFAKGERKLPQEVFLYNDQVRGYSPQDTTIQEVLGSTYNYEDLLAGKFNGFMV